MKKNIWVIAALFALTAVCSAKMYSVKADTAFIRVSAKDASKVSFKAWKYTPLQIISGGKVWCKVQDYRKRVGWVKWADLANVPSVTVKVEKAYVRRGPSSQDPIDWEVEQFFSFRVLGMSKDGWLKVTDDQGTSGWVYKNAFWGFLKK